MAKACTLHLTILTSSGEHPVALRIADKHGSSCQIHYFPAEKVIRYLTQNHLSLFLQNQEYQLRKVLNSRQSENYIKGSTLYFGIIPDFYFLKNSDFEQFILVNRRKGPLQVTVEPVPTPGIAEIFTDGSYMDTTKRSGSACIIRTSDGHEEILMTKTSHAGNNLAELFAVIEGVRFLKNDNHIRINTDSRYVIKGLAQWIHYWKINNWLTANCNPVKNIDYWKELDVLTQGKTVELHWIKGHSFHFENSFCDRAAREAALTNPAFAVKNLPVS